MPEKYGSINNPVLLRISSSLPSLRNCAQKSAVRRSCQTMALYTGVPVSRSQTMVVSRWLVMPQRHHVARPYARARQHFHGRVQLRREDVHRVVFDPAGLWKILRDFVLGDARDLASVIEEHRPGAGGTLVQRENVLRHGRYLPELRVVAFGKRAVYKNSAGADCIGAKREPTRPGEVSLGRHARPNRAAALCLQMR